MRQMTLNNALNEKNVWFRVTPEQANNTATILKLELSQAIAVELTSDGDAGYWASEETLSRFIDSFLYKRSEQIQIIEEVPFKTQKEAWEFLVSNEGNVVEHTLDGTKLTLVNGELFNIGMQSKCYVSLIAPSVWKPSSELYKPKPKEWWELNGNKPTFCWYGDNLERIKAKTAGIGLCVKKDNYFYNTYNPTFRWRYAVPLTLEEFHKFAFKPLEN